LKSPLLKINAGIKDYGSGFATATSHYFNFFSNKRFCVLNIGQTETLFAVPQEFFQKH
jgi:hypothetical protein